MQYVTSIERIAKEQAFQEGYREGFQQGLQEGHREGMSSLFGKQLAQRFGPLPEWATAKLQSASAETLLALAVRIFDAQALEEIFV